MGIGQKISSEVLGTLLGGISVYVLQSALLGKNNNLQNNETPNETTNAQNEEDDNVDG